MHKIGLLVCYFGCYTTFEGGVDNGFFEVGKQRTMALSRCLKVESNTLLPKEQESFFYNTRRGIGNLGLLLTLLKGAAQGQGKGKDQGSATTIDCQGGGAILANHCSEMSGCFLSRL